MAETPKLSQQRLEFEAHFVENPTMIDTFNQLWTDHGPTFEKVLGAVPAESREAVDLFIQQLAADALTRGWNTGIKMTERGEQ